MCNKVKHDEAQEAVAYLDIGAGGYLDLGSDVEKDAARYRIMMKTENLRSDSEFSRGCYRFFSERDLPINDKRSWDMAIDAALQSTSAEVIDA